MIKAATTKRRHDQLYWMLQRIDAIHRSTSHHPTNLSYFTKLTLQEAFIIIFFVFILFFFFFINYLPDIFWVYQKSIDTHIVKIIYANSSELIIGRIKKKSNALKILKPIVNIHTTGCDAYLKSNSSLLDWNVLSSFIYFRMIIQKLLF